MKYTDKELVDSTQIAYLNILQKGIDKLDAKNEKNGGTYTIEQIVRAVADENGEKSGQDLRTVIETSKLEKAQKQKLLSLSDEAYQWKILDIQDSNKVDGFFACTIDKGQGDAIVAFRGSESLDSPENILHDWLNADAGLLNSKQTYQQRDAEQYIQKLIDQGTLKDANSIGVTGHSLGGNLAQHFTVMCAGTEFESKIEKCVSFDGPGFSDEYIKAHQNQINTMMSKSDIVHYKWSLVGGCLNSLPGETVLYPNVYMFDGDALTPTKIDKSEASFGEKLGFDTFTCHDTRSLDFNSEGMLDCNTYASAPIMMSNILTNYLDEDLNSEATTVLMFFGAWALALYMDAKNGNHEQINNLSMTITDEDIENLKKCVMSPGFILVVYEFVSKALIPFLTAIAPAIPYIIAAVVVIAVIYYGYKFFEEYGEYIITSIQFFLMDKYNDFKDIIENACAKFLSCFRGIKSSFLKEYWGSYRYAFNNPYLDMNTDTLRVYANRLRNVNNRLANVENKIKDLYWHVGLVDMLKIVNADILVNYSSRLNGCKNYLEHTADRFDNAEKKISNAF